MSDSEVPTVPSPSTVSEQPQQLTGRTDVPSKPEPVMMIQPCKAPDSDKGMSREVRLGLVLYGGVSLAIYMNGVAHEFFNAVRGRGIYALIKALTDSDVIVDIVSGASAGGINGIFLAYALCNEKEFGDFAQLWRNQGDVDLLLRKPGGAPETYLSLFDSEHYYQQSLQDAFRVVRDIDQANVFEMPSGVLDGSGPKGAAERPHVKELDLYIAGTNVGGNIFTETDDAGHAITVKDHRTVFILSHRRGRKTPFAPKDHPEVTCESLAKLSRITSAFPAAFSPVKVEGVKPDKVTVEGRLQRWGQIGVKAYFIDGGVLYNKPFSCTIKGIEFRLANTETERFLLYVEPDPERFDEELKQQQAGLAEAPNFFTDISDSLISLPGYQSIAGDLQTLADHNSKVQRYLILTKTLQERVWNNPEEERRRYLGTAAPPGAASEIVDTRQPAQELHYRSRLLGLGERVIRGALRNKAGRNMFLKPAQAQAAEKLTYWLFELLRGEEDQKTVLETTDVFYRVRRLFLTTGIIRALLYKPEMKKRRPERERARTYLKLRHVLNRQIELLQIVQTVMEEIVDRYPIIEWDKISRADQIDKEGAKQAWTLVSNLLEVLLNTRGPLDISGEDYGKYRQFLLDYRQDCKTEWQQRPLGAIQEEWLPQSKLTVVLNGLREIRDFLKDKKSEEISALARIPERQPFQGLLSIIDQCTGNAFQTLTSAQDDVRVAYENFDLLDSVLYPIELAGDLQCKDVIKTVRVSPYDAQRGFSRKDISKKVAGVGFYHFAAFFKRAWRSNDIMWGRLDCICQLAECLLNRDRLDHLLLVRDPQGELAKDSNPPALESIQTQFGIRDRDGKFTGSIPAQHPLHPDALFPNNSQESRNALKGWLERVLSNTPGDRLEAINELPAPGSSGVGAPSDSGPLELLIQLAQYEVIHEVLPQVAQDAAEEQLEWNCYPVTASQRERLQAKKGKPLTFDLENGAFKEGEGRLEPTEVTIAAAAAATMGMAEIEGSHPPKGGQPKETPLGKFFDSSFGLKTASLLDNLPTSILVSIVLQAARVLSRCVLTALGSTGEAIEKNGVFRHFVDWPLRALYAWSQWWRRAPSSERKLRMFVWWTAVMLLAIGILAPHQLVFTDEGLSLPWFIALLVIPIAVLLIMYFFGMRQRFTVIVLLLAAIALSAGAVISVSHWLQKAGRPGVTALPAWEWLDVAIVTAILLLAAAALGAHWARRRPEPLLIVTPEVLKRAKVGQHYAQGLQASGGVPPYQWSVAKDSDLLSEAGGLVLTVAGMIVGWPKKSGSYVFTLQVSDSRLKKGKSRPKQRRQQFQITVSTPGDAPPSSDRYSASLGAPQEHARR